MAKIICKVNMGLKNQTVYIQHGQTLESFEIPTQNIANFIMKQQGISQVYLGGSQTYVKKIEKDVKELELKEYSNNKIKFIYNI